MFDPKFFLGIVTSNEDPDKRGRVRVRVMGIHTELTQPMDEFGLGIKEEDLPLAQCMYPVTYSGTKGTCPPPSLLPGDWVLGVSLDGNSYQNLMVLGLAKAKFNAESLADGSIDANDAFATSDKPASDSEMKEVDAKAQEMKDEILEKAEANDKLAGQVTTESYLAPLKGYSENYEEAKDTGAAFARGDTSGVPFISSSDSSDKLAEEGVALLKEGVVNDENSSGTFLGAAKEAIGNAYDTVTDGIAKGYDAVTSGIAEGFAPVANAAEKALEWSIAGQEYLASPEWANIGLPTNANGETIPYNTDAFDTAISDGMAVYNIVKYIKETKPKHYDNFKSSSHIEFSVDDDFKNNIMLETLGEGYYQYCYEYFNNSAKEKSHILPTFAYNMGVGETEDYLMWYGDPRDETYTYAKLILNMRNDGLKTEADFLASVIRRMNNKYNTKIATIDTIAKNFQNHQYIEHQSIKSVKFRGLGTVVMPTQRSTVSQEYITLPNYSVENNYSHEHFGIDFVTGKKPVLAMADGVVTRIYDVNPEDCNAVVLQHACELKTMYMHMSPIKVKEGQRVNAGEVIGIANGYGENGTNTTPTHLHFEIKHDTNLVDPLDFMVNTLGFYIRVMNTASMYKRDALDISSDLYKKIQKDFRNDKNISWSF